MGELHGDCPALNHAIEWVEKVPVSGNPLVDARNAQVGSLADRSRTYHAETTFPTALNIRIIVEVCRVLFLLTAFFSMQHGSGSSGDRPRGTDSPEVVKFLLYIFIVLTKVPTARSLKPPPICLVETSALFSYSPLARLDYLLLGHTIHVGSLENARRLFHSTLSRW